MLILGSGLNASLLTARAVERASTAMSASIGKLSSGRRIGLSSDDAGGLAVSTRLAAAFKMLNATDSNLTNLHSFKTAQDQCLSELGTLLSRMGELKTLSSDPTKNQSDKRNYGVEYSQLSAQARSINDRTFNGIRLFSATKSDQALSVSSSNDSGQTIGIVNPTLSTSTLIDVISDKVYSIQTGQMEWGEAEADATAKGGALAKFTSSDDLAQALFQLGSDVNKDPLWIGLTQTTGATQPGAGWGWVSGGTLAGQTYQNWAGGQPDNGGSPEPSHNQSADALAWNQPASVCATSGHIGDELNNNGDGVVSGYVVQYTDSTGATKYKAVTGSALTWDAARQAAYNPGSGDLPARTNVNLGASTTTLGSNAVTVTSATGLRVGMVVTGAGIAPGTKVTGVNNLNITLSSPATATAAGVGLTADFDPGSHLATLRSTGEYANAKAQLEAQGVGANQVLWLGAYQSPSSVNEADPSVNWHWVSNTEAGDSLTHPATDAAVDFSTVTLHSGELDNASSGAANEKVAYMSGAAGKWSDSTPRPDHGGTTVKGYLMEKDTISTVSTAQVSDALQFVAQLRASVGAEMSRIEYTLDNNRNNAANLEQAQSRIMDVDTASETVAWGRSKILLQAAMSMLTQANNSAGMLLKLLE